MTKTKTRACFEQDQKRRWFGRVGAFVAALAGAVVALPTSTYADPPPSHGIVAAYLGVEQLGPGNAPSDIVVTNQLTIGDFRVRPTANRGDYDVQIGDDLTDDVAGGVLITSIAEHTRDTGTTTQTYTDAGGVVQPAYDAGPHVATVHIDGQAGGSYSIPLSFPLPNSLSTAVIEYNMNISAGWFPYDKYIGAYIRNSGLTNGGAMNFIAGGSPGFALGTNFVDKGGGKAVVDLRSFGYNSQTDGVLLVIGAKNEDNYALSQAAADGTWNLFSKDNGTDTTSYEQDPFAFVFIPKTNSILVSGRFTGDGTIQVFSGGAAPNFTITNIDVGTWELKIPGGGPRKGVLLISPEGGGTQNRDNIVTYQPNDAGDGWTIESRDLPNAVLPPLETPGNDPVASFVYIPGPSPGFLVTPSTNLFTSEDGTTATFTVTLETKSSADVTIALSSSNTAEGTVSPASLTFTTNDWNIAQTVTVTGVEDTATDGPVTYKIVLAPAVSDDADYSGRDPVDATVVNIDNDGGIIVNPTGGLTTTEAGGTATFTVRLAQAPTADVMIGLSSSNTAEGTVSPESLTFTSNNWNVDQTVTVMGVDDFVDDSDVAYSIITAAAMSADPFFSGRNPANVGVVNTDDDTAGITVTPTTGLTIVETGGSTAYSIVLKSQPIADVVISAISGDLSEGTVTPTNFTFNASNWNLGQVFTVNAVDDLIVDGNVKFVITNSLTSTDPLYAAIDPADVTVTTLDDEAVLTLPFTATWAVGTPAVGIAGRATIVDPYTTDYAGGALRVALTNGLAEDRLAIRSVGTNDGQINITGTNVNLGAVPIGSFSGGQGTNALVVNLNGNASPAVTEALLRAVTFENVSTNPPAGLRGFTVTLTDAGGAMSAAASNIRVGLLHVTNFQEGADFGYGPYTGAADIELNQANPDQPYPTGRSASGLLIDWPDDNLNPPNFNAGQVLLRFDNMVGDGPNQIPTNAIIVSAELYLDINDTGDGSPLYRMLVPWDATAATWNSVGGGIALDDVTARSTFDSQIGVSDGSGATTVGTIWVSVLPDVQAWVNGGEANYGWVLPAWPNNRDGTFFSPSEAANVADRPRLRVTWLPKDSVSTASFRQGVDNYTGAVDTRIRENAPDTDFSSVTTVFVDALVSAGDPNAEQVLLRFDNIFGTDAGQIPPGAHIEAAMLDLASVGGDAMGDGGQFFAMLQPWPDGPLTWNSFTNGIQTNGVEAASTPTAVAGNPGLDPDVQGGYLSFELTKDVQDWASGARTNAGWAVLPWVNGGNGWGFNTSEIGTEKNRPRLRVYYTAAPAAGGGEIHLQADLTVGASAQFRFNADANKTYSVFRAAMVDGAWTNIGTATTDPSGLATFSDATPLSGQAFYRIGFP